MHGTGTGPIGARLDCTSGGFSMPADFSINPQLGIVFSKATGVFSHAEALDHMIRLSQHPGFRPEFDQLLDGREITKVELSADEVRDLATRTIFSVHSKRAFVTASDHDFGIARMFGTYREIRGEDGIRIFRDMAEALAWLSLTAEPDPKLFQRLFS
jgi:hypothetical protein